MSSWVAAAVMMLGVLASTQSPPPVDTRDSLEKLKRLEEEAAAREAAEAEGVATPEAPDGGASEEPAASPLPPPGPRDVIEEPSPVDRYDLRAAYDAGRGGGRAGPLKIYGGLYTGIGLLFILIAQSNDDQLFGDLFMVIGGVFAGVGLAQLIPGMLSSAAAERGRPRGADPRALHDAFEAGWDVGRGRTLIGYGTVFALSLFDLMDPSSINEDMLPSTLLTLGIVVTHLGFGISRLRSGNAAWSALRARHGGYRSRLRGVYQGAWRAPAQRKRILLPVVALRF